jgi:putative hydrolase of the HAD superfamily
MGPLWSLWFATARGSRRSTLPPKPRERSWAVVMGCPPSPLVPTPRLLLFDLDDTLCDYATARDARLRRAFGPAAARLAVGPASAALLDRLVAASVAIHPHGADHFADLLRDHGLDDPEIAAAAVAWYRTNRFHSLALFADAAATLAALRTAGDGPSRRLGVITNGPADVQRAKVELLAIERLVDFVVISGEFGAWKPDPAIFAEALRLGRATAAEAVFVGDSAEHDIAGARAAGIRAVWVNRTGRPWSHPEPPPDLEVDSLTALVPLLGGTAATPPLGRATGAAIERQAPSRSGSPGR